MSAIYDKNRYVTNNSAQQADLQHAGRLAPTIPMLAARFWGWRT